LLAERRFSILAFVFLILFWSSAFGAIKVSLEYAPPILFAGMRTLLCGLVVALAALVWGGRANLRRDWLIYLILAVLNVVLFMGLQTFTILYMPSGSAAVVIYLQPILVGLASYLVLSEQLSVPKVVGLVLGFSGVVVVSTGSLSGSSLGTPLGVAFGVGSALSWTLGTVYFKWYGERLSTLWAVAVPFSGAGAGIPLQYLLDRNLLRELPLHGARRHGARVDALAGPCEGGRGEPGLGLRVLRTARLGPAGGSFPGRNLEPLAPGRRCPRHLRYLSG